MITAVILAAGESRRMGRQKVLLPYGDSTILGHILDQIGDSDIGATLVVTGHQPEAVHGALAQRMTRAVHNPDYQAGMLSSVRAGLRALPEGTTGIMLFLGDHPEVSPGLIQALIGMFEPERGDLVVPSVGGRRGHPLLFDAGYVPEILVGYEDTGLRGIFQSHPDHIIEVAWSDKTILADLDTPADYEAARLRAKREDG